MSETEKTAARGAVATGWQRDTIYLPQQRPGFVAWATAFDYGDGSIGLTFKETLRRENPGYTEPKLEFFESVAAVTSYSSVVWGSPGQCSYRVYMRSADGGQTFTETGRAPENVGSYCNVGYPDGRILGFHVPNVNEEGTAWAHRIDVKESRDGGTTWQPVTSLLEGNAVYLWRVRRLRSGTIILMASLYGSAWGPGYPRATRNTMLPGESYISKIQPFFMASTDGRAFTGPHYILPGTGAHEYDFVELEDDTLLFIAGDVQATPVARQKVRLEGGRFINHPVHTIHRGAPQNPQDAQSGFVPETIVRLPGGLIVGARRNKPYSCSVDEGANWHEIDGLPPSLYQPFMLLAPDGATVLNFGHFGGDVSFGQADMYMGVDRFRVQNNLPAACALSLGRCLAADESRYLNRYRARLTAGGRPVARQEISFRFLPSWSTEEQLRTAPPQHAAYTLTAVTDENGEAEAGVDAYDKAGDIHFAYTVQAFFRPAEGAAYLPCESPLMSVTALRPHRRCAYPYAAYLAEGVLFLAPAVLAQWPDAPALLAPYVDKADGVLPAGALPAGLQQTLLDANVLVQAGGALRWQQSVHAPTPLAGVLPMADGDWCV